MIEKNKLSPIKRRKLKALIRNTVQLIFFIFFPSLFVSSFNGFKTIIIKISNSEPIKVDSFLLVSISLCLFTILFGRFFCGYVCAFGTLNDAVRAVYLRLCKKLKKKPISISEKLTSKLKYLKYLILCFVLIMCYADMYSALQGTNPWDVFSRIRAGSFDFDGYAIGAVLLFLLIPGMAFCDRFFCRFFCPMGAIFSMLPVLPFSTITREKNECAKGCSACRRVCPADIDLPERGSYNTSGECFQCGKCVDICPKKNAGTGKKIKGTEICYTLLKTALMFALAYFITYKAEILI